MKRQFITDEKGERVGVILPIEEFSQFESLLRRQSTRGDDKRLRQLEQAIRDPLFMTGLKETMSDFAVADSDWWEPGG